MSENRPRLWCVSELYYPEQGTAAHLITQTAEGLVADFDVHILCGQPDYFVRGTKAPKSENRNGTQIRRVRGTRLQGQGLLARLINSATFALVIFVFAIWHFRKGDRILAATNPPPMPSVIGLVSKLRQCRSTLLVHDVYPEVLLVAETLKERSLAYRFLTYIFNRCYRMFDAFVVLGVCMRDVVQRKLGDEERPIAIIPNWADEDIRPISRHANSFRIKYNLVDKFVVQFSGNFGRTHDIELLLDAARLLADRTDVVFMFVGGGAKMELVADKHAGTDNVLILPRQPRDKLCEMLNASDLTVISFIDGMLGLSVPSRMYNVMAAGVPIAASAHPKSELVREIKSADSGWVIDDADPEQLADLIRSIAAAAGSPEAQRKGHNGHRAVQDRYLAHHAIDLYRRALR